ncbi:MAG: hypothetical protein ACYSSL_02800 [Planctomycetota bacterium]
MKILHLPTAVGGNSWALAQGEKKIGLDPTVLVRKTTWLDYPCDIDLDWENKSYVGMLLSGMRAFFEVRKKYGVFHFNFGSSLIDIGKYGLPLMDIPFYPDDKKIVFTFNGCDARQKYRTVERFDFSACHSRECYRGICNYRVRDWLKRRKIKKAGRYAGHIFYLNPDLFRFLPEWATFLPYASGVDIEPVPYRIERKLKIVHAPTERATKGSSFILQGLRNLKKKFNIEIELVENVPHRKALEIYKQAHLVIDQCLIGWYGGLAVEVMKMGKPVATFIRNEDLKFIPDQMAHDVKETFINITPINIEDALAPYIENTSLLSQKSKAALDYVYKWHDPVYVANITKAVYES